MAALPYIPLYIADYLADTAHLTRGQSGSYLYLLMNYWQTGKALDNKGERLAIVARMTAEEWAIEKPILAEFFTVKGNKWTHHRVEADLEKVFAKSKKASFAGSAGARKRANERIANAEQTLNHTKPSNHTEADTEADTRKNYFFAENGFGGASQRASNDNGQCRANLPSLPEARWQNSSY